MELEATRENVSADGRIDALIKIMKAKDNEVDSLNNRVTLLQDRLKCDIVSPYQFKIGDKDRLRHELRISDRFLDKTNQELLVENEALRSKLETAMKSSDECILLKKEFDQMQFERKEFHAKINNIISSIQEEKSRLNSSLEHEGRK